MSGTEVWKEAVRIAPDEQLFALRDANFLGLRDLDGKQWRLRIEVVEEEILNRMTGKWKA